MPQPALSRPELPPFPMPALQELPLRGLTVLAVEDSRYTSDILRLMCQRSGARLRRAETLAQATAHLRLYRPDLVIVDLGLPDGRGEWLIRALTGPGGGPVVLGSSADPDGRRPALAAGAVGFLEKPLPDLRGFQSVILSHLKDRALRAPPFLAGIAPDSLALADDLRFAEAMLAKDSGHATRDWLRGFLAGLALQAQDPMLSGLAEAISEGQKDSAAIGAALRKRLEGTTPFHRDGNPGPEESDDSPPPPRLS